MRRTRTRLTPLLALPLVAGLTLTAGAATATGAPTGDPNSTSNSTSGAQRSSDDRFLKFWSPEWMARRKTPYTPAELTAMANKFSIIATMPNRFKSQAASMRATNPALKFVVYKNATFGSGTKFPADMYAKNASGGKVAAKDWPSTFVMALDDSRWVTEVATKCELLVRTSLYDGCFLDVLGSGPLIAPAYLLSKPVFPSGAPWTSRDWLGWTEKIAARVQQNTGLVTGNGLGEGKRYFEQAAPSSVLVGGLDGAMAEVFMRGPQDSVTRFQSEADWLADVNMVSNVEARGKAAMTVTKIWTAATPAQVNQWHRYTLGSFLLGSQGRSMMSFLRDKSDQSTEMDHLYNNVNIGTPTAPYAKTNGVYQRPFTGGRVLVNPVGAAVKVTLPAGSFRTVDGVVVSGSITIPANDAQVLTAV